MAYARSCSKLLLGLCGRFLVRPGIFPRFASKSNCVCVWAQAVFVHVRACAHLMCRCGCKYVCMHMRMCICMRACMHLNMVHKCAKVISLTPRCGGDLIRAQKWPRCGLLCLRFLFGIEQEENRGLTPRCGGDPIRA